MEGAIIGYIRVSTVEQNEGRQFKALEDAGCTKIFHEKISGKDTNRPMLQSMLDYVREGDTVVISEYSRLGRNTADLLNIIQGLTAKGIKVKSLKEGFDTSTPQGKLMLTFFAGIAEFERDLILQRQREGIAIAKAEGKYKGRKAIKKPDNWEWIKVEYMSKAKTATAICQELGIGRNTFYKWLNEEKGE